MFLAPFRYDISTLPSGGAQPEELLPTIPGTLLTPESVPGYVSTADLLLPSMVGA